MRILLFFDLPTLTSKNMKDYRKFVKLIKTNGFYMIQESVYTKMAIDQQSVDSTISKIKEKLPDSGSIISLVITERQFSSMEIILGEMKTDVLNTNERIVYL